MYYLTSGFFILILLLRDDALVPDFDFVGEIPHRGKLYFKSERVYQQRPFRLKSPTYKSYLVQRLSAVVRELVDILAGDDKESLWELLGESMLFNAMQRESRFQQQTDKFLQDLAKTYENASRSRDGRVRVLSIIARYLRNNEICAIFHRKDGSSPSANEITAARRHAAMYGIGGEPPASQPIMRQRIKAYDIIQLTEFLYRESITRTSFSNKLISVTGMFYVADMMFIIQNRYQRFLVISHFQR